MYDTINYEGFTHMVPTKKKKDQPRVDAMTANKEAQCDRITSERTPRILHPWV